MSVPVIPDGKYSIERLLASGGMGSVYVGRDVVLDRPVAIKVIRADLLSHTAAHERFAREAQIVAGLQHPSIVTIFDYGMLPAGDPYLVMELVRGIDLRRELAQEGRLDAGRAIRILADVCAAMEAAHRDGVLHGDLKPENILLPDEGVEAKVLDFGVAQAVGGERTAAAAQGLNALPDADTPLIGTPAYMAPELLRGAPADTRTDVFSLGVIAYEMLVGALPFGAGSIAEVALAQARGPHAAGLHSLPAALARAVTSTLAIDADRRPVSAQALAHLFGAAAAGL